MTKAEFCAELESILEMEPDTIKGSETLADLPAWDSLAVLSFIAMVDAKLEASVPPGSLASCRTVDDLAALFPGKIA